MSNYDGRTARPFQKELSTKMRCKSEIVLMAWDEGQWASIPYDTKQQIFESFKLMKPSGASIRITGYYSRRTLAETGLLSDTLR